MTRLWLILLLLGLGAGSVRAAAGSGSLDDRRIAYVRYGRIYVARASGGPAQLVPNSKGTLLLSLSPTRDTLLFFVAPSDEERPEGTYVNRGYISRAPFTRAELLPEPLDRSNARSVEWTPDGKTAYVRAHLHGDTDGDGFSDTADEEAQWWRFGPLVGRRKPDRIELEERQAFTMSRDRRTGVWASTRGIHVQTPNGKVSSLFSIGDPLPLLAAVRSAAGRPFRDLRNVPRTSWTVSRNWAYSDPAVTPDGKKVYFAANAGLGVDRSEGTTFCFFVVDVTTRKLSVLSRLGSFKGRIPQTCSVSPDGKHLLFNFIHPGPIIDNTREVWVVDLRTEAKRELLSQGHHRRDYNMAQSQPSWSPDGRYVALDVLYYQITDRGADYVMVRPWRPGVGRGKEVQVLDWHPGDADFSVCLFEAATGRSVRSIPHAHQPAW